jgi:ring-1,2-phenylacetyl-CoA epoxidase subunit PaaD
MVAAAQLTKTGDAAPYWAALEQVLDPEVPVVSVVDLGMIRQINVADGRAVEVEMTPTYTGCPATKMIEELVRGAVLNAGADEVKVSIVLDPPWTTDWLSQAGREKLIAYGIAPPVHQSTSKMALMGTNPEVGCPRCGSNKTVVVSEFGSTACKALYQCRDCLEPFDYFKCI